MDQYVCLIQLGVSFVNLKDCRKITHRLKTYSQKPLQNVRLGKSLKRFEVKRRFLILVSFNLIQSFQ